MTEQIVDTVTYKDYKFILIGFRGTGLFTPIDLDIPPEKIGFVTVCCRGYCCQYNCIDGKLFLTQLSVVQNNNHDELPLLEGIAAESDNILFSHYQNLKILCPFSGGLVLARTPSDPIRHYSISPIEFEEVVEVIFKKGTLQHEIDHSAKVAELRKTLEEYRESFESKDELSEVIRKLNSHSAKLSERERRMLIEYWNEINDKTIELDWSFVSDYEQQPSTRRKPVH